MEKICEWENDRKIAPEKNLDCDKITIEILKGCNGSIQGWILLETFFFNNCTILKKNQFITFFAES